MTYAPILFTQSLETGTFLSVRPPPTFTDWQMRTLGLEVRTGLTQGREACRESQREQLPRRKAGVVSTMAGTKALLTLENFINGKFVPCNSYIDSYDPSTGDVYCRVPNSGEEEVSGAPGWGSLLSVPWFCSGPA